ncbi:RNA methyltransferase [Eubacteriaceae bacterium ES2]|nr:RNA methyltransferase [Eubacteriaceae bacterium ES2]
MIIKLRQKKYRDETELFIIDGKKILDEALRSHAIIERVFFSEQLKGSEYVQKYLTSDLQVFWIKKSIFEGLTGMKNPEGVLAIVKKCRFGIKRSNRYIILEDIQDPNNVGTIIRTADAAGFDTIIGTSKTVDFFNEKVVRGSMGSLFHLNLKTTEDCLQLISSLHDDGVKIIGTALDGVNLFEQTCKYDSFALILGNESRGMSEALKNKCDTLYQIPIFGQAESLNVSVAAGIVMYQLIK